MLFQAMKHSISSRAAFTLIELLVVISIIAILASLAIPAVTGALSRGQLTGSLNNARQLAILTQQVALDSFTTGDTNAPGWPGSNNFGKWAGDLTRASVSTNELLKLLSAPGKNPSSLSDASAAAFAVYGVQDNNAGDTIFITTQNWIASTTPSALSPESQPFGDKGFVVIRKGGDGSVYRKEQATNQISFFGNTNVLPRLN
jgi:prepilin-type N-terminal cleavage/methylation domain-containing protein